MVSWFWDLVIMIQTDKNPKLDLGFITCLLAGSYQFNNIALQVAYYIKTYIPTIRSCENPVFFKN